MDFTFIEELRKLLETSNVLGWSFLLTGCKSMALALLMFKLINTYITDFDNDTPKLGNIFSLIGYACIIMSCDWIIGFIEGIFSQVNTAVETTPSNLYGRMDDILKEQMELYNSEDIGFFDMTIDVIFSFLFYIAFSIISFLFKIADLSMTAGYLLTRVFMIQLFKLLFPLIIAMSTLDATKDLLGKWIKKYIGLMVLGLGYIAIINFCNVVQNVLEKQFIQTESGESYASLGYTSPIFLGCLITTVVVFTVKFALFGRVTAVITNFFA